MRLDLTFHASDTTPNPPAIDIRTLKPWGGPMTADSYSATVRVGPDGLPIGQFSHIQLYTLDANGRPMDWGSNETASRLTLRQLLDIADMQPDDGFTRDQKMDWLLFSGLDRWGSPLRAEYSDGKWWQATDIRIINAVYARNPVQVLSTTTRRVQWRGVWQTVPMCRIRTGWDVVHDVTCVNHSDVPILPRGRIVLPLVTRTEHVEVMERWLA